MKYFIAKILALTILCVIHQTAFAAESAAPRTEWECTVAAAKTEGQLTIYHWGTPRMLDAGAFQKAYPESKVNIVSAMGTNLMQRILAERRAGKYLPDVIDGGTASPSQDLAPANAIEPIRAAFLLPEVANEALRKVVEDALAEAGER